MMFVKLREFCDWEGESWNFYLPVEGNKKGIEELRRIMKFAPEFRLDERLLPESEVDTLVKHTDSGYMDFHNKLTGILNIHKLKKITAKNYCEDSPFYKGRITDFIKEGE